MYILKPILDKNWENTEKMDAKRIASQTEPEGLVKILDIPYIFGNVTHNLVGYMS